MQPLFKNSKLAEQYQADGYVKIPFASAAEIKSLKEIFANHYGASGFESTDFFYSLLTNNAAENTALKNEIASILQPCFENYFENHQVIAESFLAKPQTTESMLLHQDWSYTDEAKNNCATLWLPLQDVTAETGALFLIKGSHRFFDVKRSGTFGTARIDVNGELLPHISCIDVAEGESVFFHPAVFHGSYPNTAGAPRIVAATVVLPERENFIYYHKTNSDELAAFSMTEEVYYSQIKLLTQGIAPSNCSILQTTAYHHQIPTTEMLIKKLKTGLHHAL